MYYQIYSQYLLCFASRLIYEPAGRECNKARMQLQDHRSRDRLHGARRAPQPGSTQRGVC